MLTVGVIVLLAAALLLAKLAARQQLLRLARAFAPTTSKNII
jgi:hypothetical protein